MLSASVSGPDARRARQGALAVITALRSFEPSVLANYDRLIALRRSEIDRLNNAMGVLQGLVAAQPQGTVATGLRTDSAASALLLVGDALAEKQLGLLTLQGYAAQARDLVTRSPVVVVSQIPRDRRPIVAAFLVGGILAVIIVYLRYVIGLARRAPDYVEKRDRILRALPFLRARVGSPDEP